MKFLFQKNKKHHFSPCRFHWNFITIIVVQISSKKQRKIVLFKSSNLNSFSISLELFSCKSRIAQVTRITDIQRLKSEEEVGRHSYNLRSSPIVAGKQTGSELSGSDDAFFSDSESQTFRLIKERTPISTLPPKENMKKKRRAPMSPWVGGVVSTIVDVKKDVSITFQDKINGSPLGSPPPKPPLPDLSAKHNM